MRPAPFQIPLLVKRSSVMHRKSQEVAIQAIIYGAIGFRASLEVTEHSRCATLCSQLLPWLEQQNYGDQIEEVHRQMLETPYRELTQKSQTEAVWHGEAASLLAWAIQVSDKPDPISRADPGFMANRLSILRPSASELVNNAVLRPAEELEDFCVFCLTVRHCFQRPSLDEAGQATLDRIYHTRLEELGLKESLVRRPELENQAAELAAAVPSVRGLYVVRALTSEWLLGQDP
ncbi:DUF4272 domain-containing protein [Blastopirellula marina]|uniref:Uncharacterized protein n=1 Tax=Blastopirellula marina TaxID=124 RepID=A0A2S8GJ09_9BACT|nr:DUF4272 domain-containing protein [Blastopirellula marina]PQO44427.1 hypothetical protein C5Y93_18600 [Blastopirellula marina]